MYRKQNSLRLSRHSRKNRNNLRIHNNRFRNKRSHLSKKIKISKKKYKRLKL